MNKSMIYDNDDRILRIETLQEKLLDFAVAISSSTAAAFFLILLAALEQHADSKGASIKNGKILKVESVTEYSKNIQKNKIQNVVIDINNNGIEDTNDVVIDGKLFTFSEAKEGRDVIFLQSKRNMKPLAVENDNGEFDIKKTPSETFRFIEVEHLDEKFNNIIAQKTR